MSDNFLLANPEERVKKQVKNIIDSYSHPWDIIAELTQNSVDAIKEWESKYPDKQRDHYIDIEINKANKSIAVEDSGIGFQPNQLPDLLAPNATAKADDFKTVGEKGVGVTFCIFCSNDFMIDTRSTGGTYKAHLRNARTWRKKDKVSDVPDTEDEDKNTQGVDPDQTGTTIQLEDVNASGPEQWSIFDLSFPRLDYLLRTKTAIGNTKNEFLDSEPNIDVNLTLIEESGETISDSIEFKYYYPHLFWDEDEVIDLEEFQNRDDIGRLSDKQKREHLEEKVWKISGVRERSSGNIRYYAAFLPSSKAWEKISKQNELVDESGTPDIEPGIYISTRGMPTGITIDSPEGGSAGYWPHTYMLIDYDGFQFDLGRKSIAGRTQGMLKELAKEKFRLFVNWRNAISTTNKTPPTKPTQVVRQQRQDRFEKMDRLHDLNYPNVNFQKRPDSQEAGVVAIFHELIGSGELDNYKCYRTGYKQDYDFWGKYEAATDEIGEDLRPEFEGKDVLKQNIVLEAKYDAADVIKDIERGQKYLADIDMIYCWTISEEEFADSSLMIQGLKDSERLFVGSTHKVVPADSDSVIGSQLYIMSIEDYISENM